MKKNKHLQVKNKEANLFRQSYISKVQILGLINFKASQNIGKTMCISEVEQIRWHTSKCIVSKRPLILLYQVFSPQSWEERSRNKKLSSAAAAVLLIDISAQKLTVALVVLCGNRQIQFFMSGKKAFFPQIQLPKQSEKHKWLQLCQGRYTFIPLKSTFTILEIPVGRITTYT